MALVSETLATHQVILGQLYREAHTYSKDPSTQLAAVIVSPSGTVKWSTMAVNGMVNGWVERDGDWERPRKYQLVEHAERNAIYSAAKNGVHTKGATMYCTWAACVDCARAIVQSGITRLVRHYPPLDDATERWLESVQLGDSILKAGGVEILDIIGLIPEAFPILRGGEVFDPSRA